MSDRTVYVVVRRSPSGISLTVYTSMGLARRSLIGQLKGYLDSVNIPIPAYCETYEEILEWWNTGLMDNDPRFSIWVCPLMNR